MVKAMRMNEMDKRIKIAFMVFSVFKTGALDDGENSPLEVAWAERRRPTL